MSLLAPNGSVLIFEQPELHLHPLVQSRLGDFFLSLIELGKQCVVETHSEYLVNRLRLRAALDSADAISRSVGLYFVEKAGGKTTYRRVAMNEFGAIADWPKGFFDQAPTEAEAILRAALTKRKARQKARA